MLDNFLFKKIMPSSKKNSEVIFKILSQGQSNSNLIYRVHISILIGMHISLNIISNL
jgi:hypothetical protein